MAAEVDLEWKAGDDEITTFEFYEDDGVTELNMEDRTFASQVRLQRGDDGTPAATLTVSVSSNQVTLTASAAQTRALRDDARRYFYDLQQIDSADLTSTLIEGSIVLTEEVTRS